MLDMDYLFGHFRLVIPAVSTPSLLPSPSLLHGLETEGATKKVSVLCKHCSAVAKTLVCPQHCHKSKPWHHGCCEGGRPSMPLQAVNTLEGAVLGTRRCLFSHVSTFSLIWRTTEASELSSGPRLKASCKHRTPQAAPWIPLGRPSKATASRRHSKEGLEFERLVHTAASHPVNMSLNSHVEPENGADL